MASKRGDAVIRDELRKRLAEYVAKYSTTTFDGCLRFLDEPVQEHHGVPESDDFYQVGVRLLENEPEYRRLHITVDDGRGFLGVVKPLTGTVIVHRDGRVETDPEV